MNNKKKLPMIAGVISLCILLMHIANKLIFAFSTFKEYLYSSNSNFYNWRFGKIHYTQKGNGPSLLLVHDLECTSSDYEWNNIVNTLANNFTVFTIDLIGCGRSDKPKITYTNYLYVQLISDFVKNVIKHKTNVAVTGGSASVIIMACYNDSQLFNNIIMINPTNMSEQNKVPKTKNKILKYIIETPILGTLFYNIAINNNSIKRLFSSTYFNNTKNIKNKYILAYNEASHLKGSYSKFLYSSMISHYTNINIVHALKELNHNIYIISGEHEVDSNTIISQYLHYNQSIESYVIKNTKHLPQLENPEELISILNIFLN